MDAETVCHCYQATLGALPLTLALLSPPTAPTITMTAVIVFVPPPDTAGALLHVLVLLSPHAAPPMTDAETA